ncbi:MAG: hypothetical protein K2M17_05845 [Bacilli bacterium]|nr:hypothetical protein [Bacilli bacterium]
MNYLNKILSDERLDEIIWGYDMDILHGLEDENVEAILSFLIANGASFWEEIIVYYLDLFLLDVDDFIEKYRLLQCKYPREFVCLEENMNLLEEMWN